MVPFCIRSARAAGLRLRDEEIFVFDRNGLWRLHDRDGNGEADYHELFCSQIDQTAETREFASALEVMKDGSFVVCKPGQTGSTVGRSSGAILRISPDGRKVTRLADGFASPTWVMIPLPTRSCDRSARPFRSFDPRHLRPKGLLLRAPEWGCGQGQVVSPPLSWIPHQQCGSAAAVLWLHGSKMAGLSGQPVLLSFNPPRLFQVHPDSDEFVSQGGVTPLPLSLDDPLLKGAVNPVDGLLYLTGFNIWGTKAKGKPFSVGSGPTLKKFCPLRSTFVPESVESFCVLPALSTPRPPCEGCLFRAPLELQA